MINPTEKQIQVLTFISLFKLDREYSPTNREIAYGFYNTVKCAYNHVLALEKKGLIQTTLRTSRSISITDEGEKWIRDGRYTIYDGRLMERMSV